MNTLDNTYIGSGVYIQDIRLFSNYFFDGEGIYYTKEKNKEVKKIYIYDGFLNIDSVSIDIDTNTELINISSTMYNKEVMTSISKGELFSKQSYAETLNNVNGFLIEYENIKSVRSFLTQQYKVLNRGNMLKKTITTKRLGWVQLNSNTTFIYPNPKIGINDGILYSDRGKYSKVFTLKGNFEEYTNNVLLPILNSEIGIITVSAILASILLEILDIHESFILDIFGKNGKGKTILLYALASIFGHPNKYSLEWNSTQNAIISNATELKNFPLLLDDTKKCGNKNIIAEVIYSLSGGKEKARANQDGTSKEQKTFKNITISTGETSVINYLNGESSGAGVYGRVLSIDTDIYNIFKNKEEADSIAESSKKNYGIFGVEFCKWLYDKFLEENILKKWEIDYCKYKEINFSKISHHTSIRKANHVAILQLSYSLLQEFLCFKGINIYCNNNVFEEYLLKLDNESKEQDIYEKSYNEIVEYIYTSTNRIYDRNKDGLFIPNNLIGWINENICYFTDTDLLKAKLNSYGDWKDILKEWKVRNYVITDTNKIQKTVRTPYLIENKTKPIKTYAIDLSLYEKTIDN